MKLIMENWRRFKSDIDEATRADKEGVKLPDMVELLERYSVGEDMIPTHFITFTSLHKVGINPKSKYKTPIGIYTYPLTEDIVSDIAAGQLPFAQDMPYASIVKPKDGASILMHETDLGIDAMDYIEKLFSKEAVDAGVIKNFNFRDINSELDRLEFSEDTPSSHMLDGITLRSEWPILGSGAKASRHFVLSRMPFVKSLIRLAKKRTNSQMSILWHATRAAADEDPVSWNSLMRWLGFDVVYDNNRGIIHRNEPKQAVFLHKAGLEVVETVKNTLSPHNIATKKYTPILAGLSKLASHAVGNEGIFGKYSNEPSLKLIKKLIRTDLNLKFYNDFQTLVPGLDWRTVQRTKFDWGLSTDYDPDRTLEDTIDLLHTLLVAPKSEEYHNFWYGRHSNHEFAKAAIYSALGFVNSTSRSKGLAEPFNVPEDIGNVLSSIRQVYSNYAKAESEPLGAPEFDNHMKELFEILNKYIREFDVGAGDFAGAYYEKPTIMSYAS